MEKPDPIRKLLETGVAQGVYPGAVLLAARAGRVLFHGAVGDRCLRPERLPVERETIFDLASLTKPLATTLAVMRLCDQGVIHLDEPASEIIRGEALRDKGDLTPRLLLNHCAGFADWRPFYLELEKVDPGERKSVLRHRLVETPPEYEPGKAVLYSDLGFIFLEWVVEAACGQPMHRFLMEHFYGPLSLERTFLERKRGDPFLQKEVFAATEDCPWRRRVLQGEVHDENAFALGGYSGHAGLFGTASEAYAVTEMLRRHYKGEETRFFRSETVAAFFRRQSLIADSTWALGWDTPSERDSSSGRYFSAQSVGHLGFTGTSVWMDLERDVTVVFLTNRIHTTRNNDKIKVFRPRVHDAVMEALVFNRVKGGNRESL
jgi:CubicO group peptidase (beta-lactamase class C family)